MAYSSELNDRFTTATTKKVAKRNFDKNDITVGEGLVGAPACGDVMKISIKVENGIIIDADYKIFGCGAAIASASLAAETIVGKTLQEAREITNKDIAKALNLPPVKLHCSLLAESAIKAAASNYENKQNNEN